MATRCALSVRTAVPHPAPHHASCHWTFLLTALYVGAFPARPPSSPTPPRVAPTHSLAGRPFPSAPSSPTPPPRCACPLPCEGASSSQQSSGARVHLDLGRSHGTHFG